LLGSGGRRKEGYARMDLSWTPDEAAFRHELRDWLTANAASANVSAFASPHEAKGPLLAWESLLADAGYNAVSWPAEFGGQAMNPVLTTIFNEEYFRAGAPRRLNHPGLDLLGPTLMSAGSIEQKRTLLPRILDCSDIWCQGFSEPEAGSDLASLRTTALRDGDVYRVNGQKTWCSNGPRADRMFALVRTDSTAPKHHGISYLLIDLKSPGVEVRPIKQANGAALFAEVFLDNVEVPVSNLVGNENEGWQVASQTLVIERNAARYPAEFFWNIYRYAVEAIRQGPNGVNPESAQTLARLRAQIECYGINYYASATSDRAKDIGRLNSIAKLRRSMLQTTLYELTMRSLGHQIELGPAGLPENLPSDFHERYWHGRASTIYAGTTQIQKNIISERILGLPKEPRNVG
jgi:alkylation response protein AidB-like acyl-CoA dehydrogenase